MDNFSTLLVFDAVPYYVWITATHRGWLAPEKNYVHHLVVYLWANFNQTYDRLQSHHWHTSIIFEAFRLRPKTIPSGIEVWWLERKNELDWKNSEKLSGFVAIAATAKNIAHTKCVHQSSRLNSQSWIYFKNVARIPCTICNSYFFGARLDCWFGLNVHKCLTCSGFRIDKFTYMAAQFLFAKTYSRLPRSFIYCRYKMSSCDWKRKG